MGMGSCHQPQTSLVIRVFSTMTAEKICVLMFVFSLQNKNKLVEFLFVLDFMRNIIHAMSF